MNLPSIWQVPSRGSSRMAGSRYKHKGDQMKAPAKKSRKKYPWDTLQKEGDFFTVPDATQDTARSMRQLASTNGTKARARAQGLKVSVVELEGGGYICDLSIDRRIG